jgi:hypothetical protein
MNEQSLTEVLATLPFEVQNAPVSTDPTGNPFKLVVDPAMRIRLRKALFELIEHHDQELAQHVAAEKLSLDSYKEYIEIFSRSLRETLGTPEGVAWLLESCGFDVDPATINLHPETRWHGER